MELKEKKCRGCEEKFLPARPLQTSCSYKCALIVERAKTAERHQKDAEKVAKTIHRIKKENLKTRQEWLKDIQTIFNRYIRLRDRKLGCISCDSKTAGQYHAGHYRTVKAAPELRFEESNCHKQCAQCNNFDSGNIVEYRIRLIARLGKEKVEWLERKDHQPKKYCIDELRDLKKRYQEKIKEVERCHGTA
jgi:hypothetical protein